MLGDNAQASCDLHYSPDKTLYEVMNDHSPIPRDIDIVSTDWTGTTTYSHGDRSVTTITPMGEEYTTYTLNPRQKTLYTLFPPEDDTKEQVVGNKLIVYERHVKDTPNYHTFHHLGGRFIEPDALTAYLSSFSPEQQTIIISEHLVGKIRPVLIGVENPSFIQIKTVVFKEMVHDHWAYHWIGKTEDEILNPSSMMNSMATYHYNLITNSKTLTTLDKEILLHINANLTFISTANVLDQDLSSVYSDLDFYKKTLEMHRLCIQK